MATEEIVGNIIVALVAIGVLTPITIHYYLMQRREDREREERLKQSPQ